MVKKAQTKNNMHRAAGTVERQRNPTVWRTRTHRIDPQMPMGVSPDVHSERARRDMISHVSADTMLPTITSNATNPPAHDTGGIC